jgi:putative membrane protein
MGFTDASPLAIAGFIIIGFGLILLQFGFFQAKKKNFNNHRILMIVATVFNALFLILYIIRFIFTSETTFPGPDIIRNFIYYPILISHIILSIYVIYLVITLLSKTIPNYEITSDKKIILGKDIRDWHRKMGIKTYILWTISFAGGISVFVMLYLIPW